MYNLFPYYNYYGIRVYVYTAIYICGNDPSKLREFSLRFGIINGNLDVAIPSDVV